MSAVSRHQQNIGTARVDRSRSAPTFVLADRWSWIDAAVGVLGVVLALAGLAALLGVGLGGAWVWLVAAWILIVSAVAFAPPRRGRVERVVETH
jgi:ABC-type transport system involved in cytochrome c biogenesis permease subunit